jgi:hypothetical protein
MNCKRILTDPSTNIVFELLLVFFLVSGKLVPGLLAVRFTNVEEAVGPICFNGFPARPDCRRFVTSALSPGGSVAKQAQIGCRNYIRGNPSARKWFALRELEPDFLVLVPDM